MARKWIDLNDLVLSQRTAVQSVRDGKPNAEWKLLTLWATMQMEGQPLDAEFEHAATVLLVAAIANGKLPARRGRPELRSVDKSDSKEGTSPKSSSGARVKPRTPRQMLAEYTMRMEELKITSMVGRRISEQPDIPKLHKKVIAELSEWTGKDDQVVEAWIKRADDDWTSSPQMAQNFLAKTFRGTGKNAFRENEVLLAFTRVHAERKRLKGAAEVVKVNKSPPT